MMSSPINQREFEAKENSRQTPPMKLERSPAPEQRLPAAPLSRTPPTSMSLFPSSMYSLQPLPQHPVSQAQNQSPYANSPTPRPEALDHSPEYSPAFLNEEENENGNPSSPRPAYSVGFPKGSTSSNCNMS